ncbi:hypothetical protein [Streptomyces xanthochromogenes]|uniref:DUF2530 domain-containing protein n=1 Tax=Streptomyces xanthochromogenes TaxID=67384 RepID=A0ABQ3A122_9ACTN|nr:hypothetical protein [Streptomyces xanthochromogenes]GGY29444.1 hypothetical protein GCM10010326_24110 [Streptomyces xanthochromogenes]
MLWIYEDGQWVLRPWPLVPPCGSTAGLGNRTRFLLALYWLAGTLSCLVLLGLYLLGHEVDVLIGVCAAWLVGAIVDLSRRIANRSSRKTAGVPTEGGVR